MLQGNAFAEHFASIGKAIKIPSTKKNLHDCINKISRQLQSLYLNQTTEQEEKLIKEIPNETLSGYDNINNILLKKLADVLVSPLNYVFNLSIC